MSEDELLNAFENSEPFKDGKEIRKEKQDDDEIIRELRFLYEAEENYYEPRKIKGVFGGNYVQYESNGDTGEISSIEGYLSKIRPYLSDIIDEHKDGWKIQLTAEITFSVVGEKDSEKCFPMYMHSDNLKVYIGFETSEVVNKLFKSFLDEYQYALKTKMKKGGLTYDRVRAFYYKFRKISINRSAVSHINSPEWLKNKSTINPKNKNDNKYFRYAIVAALNYQQIKSNPERISKIKRFIGKYDDWKNINFPSH